LSRARPDPLDALRAGGKRAMALALARIEAAPDEPQTLTLLDAAYASPRAQVVGITGPPGVGKSSLISRLIAAYRAQERTVGVIAVDPSSRRSGGALLGDRTRFEVAADDQGVFVRSMASRGRLGGLSPLTPAAMVLMRAVYDRVLVETVGVGQAETEVAAVSDSVVFCVQPGSGDSLQYLKAGIAEIPDVAVVTKADLGLIARRTEDDLSAALAQQPTRTEGWSVRVILISAHEGQGVAELIQALAEHHALLAQDGRLEAQRRAQGAAWLDDFVREEFGRAGLARAARRAEPTTARCERAPFARMLALRQDLQQTEDAPPSSAQPTPAPPAGSR
jgi:LAO/AO transport system kinase